MKPGFEIKLQSATAHRNRSCLADFSCIVPDILSSPAIPGNIVNIVMLLKNISLKLSEDVNRAKMQVYLYRLKKSKCASPVITSVITVSFGYTTR